MNSEQRRIKASVAALSNIPIDIIERAADREWHVVHPENIPRIQEVFDLVRAASLVTNKSAELRRALRPFAAMTQADVFRINRESAAPALPGTEEGEGQA